MNLEKRIFDPAVPELMDEPGLEYSKLEHALIGLNRLNTLGRTVLPIWKEIVRYSQQHNLDSLTVLDLASGSGYLPFALEKMSKDSSIDLQITGSDINPQCLAFARTQGKRSESSCRFIELDARRADQNLSYDVVTCSLFLHHCSPEAATELILSMKQMARRLLLISDLNRTIGGFALAFFATRLFSRSEIVHRDGVTSAQAAFTITEARKILDTAQLEKAGVEKIWPARFLISAEL